QTLDPQHLHPTATLTGLMAVKRGAAEAPWDQTAGVFVLYGRDQLVAVDAATHTRTPLVQDRIDLVFAYSLRLPVSAPRRQGFVQGRDLSAVVPVVPFSQGQTPNRVAASQRGLADPRIEARLGILSHQQFGFDLALIPVVTFPLSSGGGYLGSASVTFTPE